MEEKTEMTPDEVMRRIAAAEQTEAGLRQTAEMTAALFSMLQQEGMHRGEALAVTRTWLAAMIAAARDTQR